MLSAQIRPEGRLTPASDYETSAAETIRLGDIVSTARIVSNAGGESNGGAAQTETPQFKNFFGDWEKDPANASKVVDENGKPLVVWHGDMDPSFTVFDKGKVRRGHGFWLAKEEGESAGYARDAEPRSFYLNIRNPAREADMKGKLLDDYHANGGAGASWKAFIWDGHASEFLRSRGYDGIEFEGKYIAFEPTQIKSATDNIGTFNPRNPDIRYSIAEQRVTPEEDAAYAERFARLAKKINDAYKRIESDIEDPRGPFGESLRYSIVSIAGRDVAVAETEPLTTRDAQDETKVLEVLMPMVGKEFPQLGEVKLVKIDGNFPEYFWSSNTSQNLRRVDKLWRAKVSAIPILGDILKTTPLGPQEAAEHLKKNPSFKDRAVFYRCSTEFGIKRHDGVAVYPCDLLVMEMTDNGQRYVYDIVRMKKPTLTAIADLSAETLSQLYERHLTGESATSAPEGTARIIPDGADGIKGDPEEFARRSIAARATEGDALPGADLRDGVSFG